MSSPGRSPARRAGKGQLPNLKGTPQHAISPYRKAAAESLRGSWKSVALPDIPGQGPAGPAGPVEGPLSPDPAFQAKEGKALSAWVQAAQNGDAEAQNNIGVSYYRGINGAQKNAEMACSWWIKASAQGFAEAQYNLGVCMLHGKGTKKDEAGAVRMLQGASQQDHAEAMCMLASLYADGLAGLTQSKEDALALYAQAANLGSEEARYKRLVMEDLLARETELEALQKKIGKINDGFIQLQLERAANEEVSHAYKGAGFFLSNMKSETPARARIEQAKRAESEIKKLRHQVVEKEHATQSFSDQIEGWKNEVQMLQERILFLEQASEGAAGKVEALTIQCKKLEASEVQLKNQVKDLLAENTELRAVADWAKNQRVEALKQALSSVVKTTITEQNEREKLLRTELKNLRKQLEAALAGKDGKPVVVQHDETTDDSAAFLKRVRRDMLMQEILLKEILTGMRHEEDYHDHVEFVKEAVQRADDGERLLQGACEEVLDHIDTGHEEMTDDETHGLRTALKRIMKSIQDKKRPESAPRLNSTMTRVTQELDEIRGHLARLSENMLEVHEPPTDLPVTAEEKKQAVETKKLKLEVLVSGIVEIETRLQDHSVEVQDHVNDGKAEPWVLDHLSELQKSINQLKETAGQGVDLSPESLKLLQDIKLANQTPAASRIGTAGSRSLRQRDAAGQFRPPSANRGTMTDAAGRRGSRSPTHGHGANASTSPINFADNAEGSVTLKVIQESIEKLAEQTSGQSAERFDDAMSHVNKRLDKVIREIRGDMGSRDSSRPMTPVSGYVIGEDGQRRYKQSSDAGSQADESEFPAREHGRGKRRPGDKHSASDLSADQQQGVKDALEKLAQEQVARVKAEMEVQIAERQARIEVLEAEKAQLESEKSALDAEKRLANNEAKRALMELEAMKKNVEQQIAFEKAMLRDEIKAAHDDADQARAERDKAVNESTALVTHMETELERKKEVFEESARQIQEANQEAIAVVMESFASKVAVHLSVIQSEDGQGGRGGNEELLADMAKQMDHFKKQIESKNDTLIEMVQELDTTLKISTKRMSRSSMGSRGGDGLGIGDAVRNGSHPGVVAPLPPEEMDAIKSDLHFAVAGAMKNVLDEHKNGVVLLNLPDHNKPAGFMHGDGAGSLHHTIQSNMIESRKLHSQLAEDMEEIRSRFSKLEEKMSIQLSSVQNSKGGDVVQKEAKATTKLLYAVQAENGSQAGVESRLLPSMEQDALSESVDEMKELLQSWYRSFSFVSRLQHAVKR